MYTSCSLKMVWLNQFLKEYTSHEGSPLHDIYTQNQPPTAKTTNTKVSEQFTDTQGSKNSMAVLAVRYSILED